MLLLPAQTSPYVANSKSKRSLPSAPITRRRCAAFCQLRSRLHQPLLGQFQSWQRCTLQQANHCLISYSHKLPAAYRYNYVTPTSYLELLTTFIKLLGEKRREIDVSRRRLETGLDKLLSTAAQVEVMQVCGWQSCLWLHMLQARPLHCISMPAE